MEDNNIDLCVYRKNDERCMGFGEHFYCSELKNDNRCPKNLPNFHHIDENGDVVTSSSKLFDAIFVLVLTLESICVLILLIGLILYLRYKA